MRHLSRLQYGGGRCHHRVYLATTYSNQGRWTEAEKMLFTHFWHAVEARAIFGLRLRCGPYPQYPFVAAELRAIFSTLIAWLGRNERLIGNTRTWYRDTVLQIFYFSSY